jgi:hypothetical protein
MRERGADNQQPRRTAARERTKHKGRQLTKGRRHKQRHSDEKHGDANHDYAVGGG